MAVSNKIKLMLFALGEYYKDTNKKLQKETAPNLAMVSSKVDFIRVVQKAGITSKKSRSIYKNLEQLEKRKLIYYNPSKELLFTPKGHKLLKQIEKEIHPYLAVLDTIRQQHMAKYMKKPQTMFVE